MKYSQKISLLFFIFGITLAISFLYKDNLRSYESDLSFKILGGLPSFSFSPITVGDQIVPKKGIKYIVHFWATWCAPCEKEFPDFLEFINKSVSVDQNIRILLVAVNDDKVKVKKFIKKFRRLIDKKFIVVLDPTSKNMELFGSVKVPETFFFDQDFRLFKHFPGAQDWANNPYYRSQIDSL